MPSPLLLIVLGIILAIFVHWGLGVALIVIGILLMFWEPARDWRPGRRAGPRA